VNEKRTPAWSIAASYAVVSILWIVLTELARAFLITDPELRDAIFRYRGWVFGTISILIVYWIARRQILETSIREQAASARNEAASQELATEREGRGRAELALAASTRELNTLNFALNQAAIVAATDARGKITFVNDNFCRISKYTREELLGQDHRIINSGRHTKAFFSQLWTDIQSGKVWHGQICNRAKDGSIYWVDTTIIPFRNDSGEIYQFMAIRHDITERKLAEEKLNEKESLARLGEMAAIVAHEVKNPLAGISGALQILATRFPEASRERQVCHEIVNRADSLARRLGDMLVFARPRTPARNAIPVKELVGGVLRQVSSDPAFKSVEIHPVLEDIVLNVDASMVSEVILNLMLNAVQAMNGSGKIEVRAKSGESGSGIIEIEDSGPGVPPHLQVDIFKPFVTTKSQGTGLGLAVARRVAIDHGGDLRLAPSPGRGARFIMELPAIL